MFIARRLRASRLQSQMLRRRHLRRTRGPVFCELLANSVQQINTAIYNAFVVTYGHKFLQNFLVTPVVVEKKYA